MTALWKSIERRFEQFFFESGAMLLLFLQGVRAVALGRNHRRRILQQMTTVGYESTPLGLVIGLFTGMTVALGTGFVLADFRQERFIASVVSDTMIKHMGPVFTAFILTARVGAAMTAEIGTMAVNEEINVLRVLGIRVDRFIVMPRVIAALIMAPALTAYATAAGLLGGAVVATGYFRVAWVTYWKEAFRYIELDEITKGLFKGLVFGAIYSSICCYRGLYTRGGAEGVGKATTSAVVVSFSGILIANYLLTRFLFQM